MVSENDIKMSSPILSNRTNISKIEGGLEKGLQGELEKGGGPVFSKEA